MPVLDVALPAPTQRVHRPSTNSARLDIQGLRTIAVLAVISDHLLGYPFGGFVGVDVFFVISGFLITGLLLREHERSTRISFRGFYRRRIKRIIPAALIVIMTTIVLSWFLFQRTRAESITWDGIYALIFGANWHYAAAGTDYMQAGGPVSPLQHFWSLAVEEQFYVFWPWLIVLVMGVLAPRLHLSTAAARRLLAGVFGLVIVASFTFSLWETAARPTVAYFSTTSRTWELAVGALLAATANSLPTLSVTMRTTLGYAGLAGIIWSIIYVTPEMSFPGPWAAVPVLSTALVIGAGIKGNQPYLYPLTNRVSNYIGNISYSLYLWHFPVIILMGSVVPQENLTASIVAVLGMVALSIASYHFIEDPIRKSSWLDPSTRPQRKKRPVRIDQSSKQAAMGVLVTVAALVVILAMTRTAATEQSLSVQRAPASISDQDGAAPETQPDTAAGRLSAEIEAASASTSWPELAPSLDELSFVPEWTVDKCMNVTDANVSQCIYGDLAATKTAVVIGDSVAISWMPGLRESLGKQGWKIQLLTKEQCPAIELRVERSDKKAGFADECIAHQQWSMMKIAEIKPDMVIVSSALNTRDRLVGAPKKDEALSLWSEATTRTLTKVGGVTDAKIVLMSVAATGKNLLECATKVSEPSDCAVAADDMDRYVSTVNAEKTASEGVEGTHFVSTVPWFCGSVSCPAFSGTTPIFADPQHITPEFSTKLAPVLSDAILGPAED
ncbi:acyltransferase family protein [Arthrobacter yangruifuii]|uniref:Acyltransferase family protein n=1 Tax=Arthrobacter yangruifuii TaxID=2606616 RepID=A0A5N6MEB2_9MICC|nr:acyltransferase family protein [Arthrobacter yangruifuii]KAD3455960.1 acyltransferase family protein [Arthrobacter yangruifuii]